MKYKYVSLIQSCAEARIQHLIRLTGQQDMERFLSTIVGQYRREISTCIVRAQALGLLSRIGQISPAARAAAQRRAGVARQEHLGLRFFICFDNKTAKKRLREIARGTMYTIPNIKYTNENSCH